MVAHTGFEPVISALRGRCPRPLDECATLNPSVYYPFFLQFLPRCSQVVDPVPLSQASKGVCRE